ncbi:DUF2170 family protein [Candidatus Enterovibrio altilux]|uniref:Cytoplasmic protein n=1 Tax=Candidatus Enterovibrio altilux TaxID=1927128 RepID=A0A291B6Y8_9GAMM|nr:DUF2170 family protein [Candidatus Enterovibrio luxaltus]ATF08757.1 hypothetical protein BTN50_0217 [Candidatus Enterovibrio luxaltus]
MTWQLKDLQTLLTEHQGWSVAEAEKSLCLTNEDGIEAFLAVAGEQILVEVLLFSHNVVKDVPRLNDTILRTHKLFPLSTICINEIDGHSYYAAFGSLSSQSKAETIIIEVATLFRSVETFLELYQDYL